MKPQRKSVFFIGLIAITAAITSFATSYSNEVEITTDEKHRYIESNAIPNHPTGAFPNAGNPNAISAQSKSLKITLNPVYTGIPIEVRQPGIALNGVKFEPGTAETYQGDSAWRYEAFQTARNLGLDDSNAHVQPSGEYHYHGIPTGLLNQITGNDDLVHVGYAADGFKMYVSLSDAYKPSYQLKSGTRSSGPGGSYDGTFTADFEYVSDSGDLDQCNGVETNGEYRYFLTQDFPYISRCLMGTPDSSFGSAGGGANRPGGQLRGSRPQRPDNLRPNFRESTPQTAQSTTNTTQHQNPHFSDVSTQNPYHRAIGYLKAEKIVEGYSDGTYQPDQGINRVEFLKVLLESKNLSKSSCNQTPNYSDVDWYSWYGTYLKSASCLGVVKGYPDGTFGPAQKINYAEAAKIVSEVYDLNVETGVLWHSGYIDALKQLNAQPRDNIQPADDLTRGEMAQIIYQLDHSEPQGFSDLEVNDAPPNILLIIADDLGLDASPWDNEYGYLKPNMPNINKLATNGLIFKNLWSNPVCSPTRAGILTGKYGVHTGVLGPVGKDDTGISLAETSLQTLITQKSPHNYAQAVIGKWHLSSDQNGSERNPNQMGIPHYSGFISGSLNNYYSWPQVTNGESKTNNQYITSALTDEAIDWIDDQETPWFLWLAHTAPHTPFHLPPKNLISDQNLEGSDIEENQLKYYLAAIEAMDTETGRLLESLSDEELANTVIIFIGDNGTPNQVAQTPFDRTKAKGSLYQGGINVPMIVSGTGLRAGTTEALINTTDFFTTIAELTGIDLPEYENAKSFASVLKGENQNLRDYAYSEIKTTNKRGNPSSKNGWAIRDTQYKYISLDNEDEFLFDLQADPYESQNLVSDIKYKAILERLRNKGLEIRQPN